MIGIPSAGSMRDETAESIFNAQREGFSFPTILKIERGPYIDHNQMKLVQDAKEQKATHLLLNETDIVFPHWAINELVEHEEMVIGATYNFKTLTPPGCIEVGVAPLVKLWDGDGKPRNISMEEVPVTTFKCYSVPTGFILIDMKVFDVISHPYFVNAWGGWGGMKYTGSDVYFCEQVRKAGLDVLCDPTITVGHLGSYQY